MTGPQHYAKAEEHLAAAASIETDGHDDSMSAWHQRQAQAHATLALAEAVALGHYNFNGWVSAAGKASAEAEVTR
jgi:hypothetical protein